MASITIVQHKPATGSSNAPAATFTAAPTQGNRLVAYVYAAVAATVTITGWTGLTASSGANRTGRLFWKDAGASESSTVTAGLSAPGAWCIAILEMAPDVGLAFNPPKQGQQLNASGATQTTATITPPHGLPAAIVAALGINANTTWSTEQINGSATGVNVDETPAVAGCSAVLIDQEVASTSGTYSASAVAGAPAAGAGSIAVFTVFAIPATQQLMMLGCGT